MKVPNPLPAYVQKLIAENMPIINEKREAFAKAETVEDLMKVARELRTHLKSVNHYCVCNTLPFDWRTDFRDGEKLLEEIEEELKKRSNEKNSSIVFTDICCSFCGSELGKENMKCLICGTPRR